MGGEVLTLELTLLEVQDLGRAAYRLGDLTKGVFRSVAAGGATSGRSPLLPRVRAAQGEWVTIHNVRDGSATSTGSPMPEPTKRALRTLARQLSHALAAE